MEPDESYEIQITKNSIMSIQKVGLPISITKSIQKHTDEQGIQSERNEDLSPTMVYPDAMDVPSPPVVREDELTFALPSSIMSAVEKRAGIVQEPRSPPTQPCRVCLPPRRLAAW